jgi:hypothetical protein
MSLKTLLLWASTGFFKTLLDGCGLIQTQSFVIYHSRRSILSTVINLKAMTFY